jgi:hypothetical protein
VESAINLWPSATDVCDPSSVRNQTYILKHGELIRSIHLCFNRQPSCSTMTGDNDNENIEPVGASQPPKAGRKLHILASPSVKENSKKKPRRTELKQVRH